MFGLPAPPDESSCSVCTQCVCGLGGPSLKGFHWLDCAFLGAAGVILLFPPFPPSLRTVVVVQNRNSCRSTQWWSWMLSSLWV